MAVNFARKAQEVVVGGSRRSALETYMYRGWGVVANPHYHHLWFSRQVRTLHSTFFPSSSSLLSVVGGLMCSSSSGGGPSVL